MILSSRKTTWYDLQMLLTSRLIEAQTRNLGRVCFTFSSSYKPSIIWIIQWSFRHPSAHSCMPSVLRWTAEYSTKHQWSPWRASIYGNLHLIFRNNLQQCLRDPHPLHRRDFVQIESLCSAPHSQLSQKSARWLIRIVLFIEWNYSSRLWFDSQTASFVM